MGASLPFTAKTVALLFLKHWWQLAMHCSNSGCGIYPWVLVTTGAKCWLLWVPSAARTHCELPGCGFQNCAVKKSREVEEFAVGDSNVPPRTDDSNTSHCIDEGKRDSEEGEVRKSAKK